MAFHLAKRMFFEACGYDAFCGLCEPCGCGRPDWFDILTEASKQSDARHKGGTGAPGIVSRCGADCPCSLLNSQKTLFSDIGVFFCGPPSMEKDLATNVDKVNNNGKFKTRFNLMAEKF
jgi:hypothetical protein